MTGRPTNTEQTLAGLMRAAQDGDAAAYKSLLTEVAGIVRRMVGSRWTGGEAAEDVVQEVLISLHTVRHTYDPGRPFLPWLAAITRNRLADVQRRQARRSRSEVQVAVLPETFSTDDPNDVSDRKNDAAELRRAVAVLPSAQRQAVELLKFREMSLEEASAASGMTIGALKSAMHRALHSLRAILAK